MRLRGLATPVLLAALAMVGPAAGGSVENGSVENGSVENGSVENGYEGEGSVDDGAAAEARDTCRALPAARALDFWLGAWEARDADNRPAGTVRIEAALDGCAILEHWSGTDGSQGLGLFYFHSWLGQWRRVWISAVPQQPGAVKEQRQDLNYRGDGLRFRGEVMVSPEHYVQDRTTLAILADGRVHRRVETSNDDGRSWQLVFEGWYRRRP